MLKSGVSAVLKKIGIDMSALKFEVSSDEKFSTFQSFKLKDKEVARIAVVSKALLKKMDIDQDVFYAEINWDVLLKFAKTHKIEYQPISKFPRVRRDLALLIDKSVTYAQLEEVDRQANRQDHAEAHNVLREGTWRKSKVTKQTANLCAYA